MLRWNPLERISVESALKDLYLNSYHNPTDEPVCTARLDLMFDEDQVAATLLLLRQLCCGFCFFCRMCVILAVNYGRPM